MKIIVAILLILTPITSAADGELTVTPIHDFLQGNGAIFELSGDAKLKSKLYLVPDMQLSTVQQYRDAQGKLDFEYRWTKLFATSVGGGYESYHHFGEDRVESEDVHAKFKFKVW